MIPRYPIYVPSKGRFAPDRALTARALKRDGVPFRLVVEPAEADAYRRWVSDMNDLIILPSDDFTLLRARNFIRDHAEAAGVERHWQLDDNIGGFYRLWEGRRIPVNAAAALTVCEDFAGRFRNVGLAGLSYDMFVIFGGRNARVPYFTNTHVYSCTLVNHAMPYRWRLIRNDDTDLCLQALVHGWGTVLLNAFMAKKVTTMTVGGGNTDDLYRDGDGDERDTYGRYEMARVLERQWPGTVRVVRKFGRFQHDVNWRKFAFPLEFRDDFDVAREPPINEYGMTLDAIREPSSEPIRRLRDEYAATVATIASAPTVEPRWRGMPAFRERPIPPKIAVTFPTPEDRERVVAELGVTVDKRYAAKAWSAWYPPRDREDPGALRFNIR